MNCYYCDNEGVHPFAEPDTNLEVFACDDCFEGSVKPSNHTLISTSLEEID